MPKHHRDEKSPHRIEYMTYVLSFPDGDQWIKQVPFVQDLAWELRRLLAEQKDKTEWKARCMALWKAGECWWKDNLGVEHLILIEKVKRKNLKWGVSKDGLAKIETGLSAKEAGIE